VAALRERLPGAVSGVEINRLGPVLTLALVRADRPSDGDRAAGGRTVLFALGSWLPFVPRWLAERMIALDAVETVVALVNGAGFPDWPCAGWRVRTRHSGESVGVWFESRRAGADFTALAIPRDLLRRPCKS